MKSTAQLQSLAGQARASTRAQVPDEVHDLLDGLVADIAPLTGVTVTAAGTTGAREINKPMGTINFATAASTLVVTNSLVTATSIVLAVVRTADSTATIKSVVPSTGSFTITLGAGATAETSVGFIVLT